MSKFLSTSVLPSMGLGIPSLWFDKLTTQSPVEGSRDSTRTCRVVRSIMEKALSIFKYRHGSIIAP